MQEIYIGDKHIRLSLSPVDGAVMGMTFQGKPMLCNANGAFSLRMLNPQRHFQVFSSYAFKEFSVEQLEEQVLQRIWTGCPELPGMIVQSSISFDGIGFRFRNEVRNIPDGFALDLIDCPNIVVPEANELFWPFNDGGIIKQPEKSGRLFQQMNADNKHSFGLYPGRCQMQFMASYDLEGSGVYFAADDYSHSTKTLEFGGDDTDPENRIRLRIECCCGHEGEQDNYQLPYDILLYPFKGNWMDASIIYRDWLKSDASLKNVTYAKWLDKSPVVIVLTTKGNGVISNEQNRYSDYQNAFPRIKELASEFESPVLVLLMRWDQHGPWLPPYCWPPSGSMESFLKLRDLLHASGNYFGVYCSGTAFTINSLISDYNIEQEFEEKQLARHMTSNTEGAVRSTMQGIREQSHLCITEDWGRNIILDQVRKIAESGVDYIQFFDQNYGAMNYPCYSLEHNHPPIPGEWMTSSMLRLIDDLNKLSKEINPDVLIGAESNAPAPYLKGLPFNDARSNHNWHYGIPVPAYSFIHHKYSNNFMGNECEMWQLIDCEAKPDNLLLRIALGFISGQMLAVTLRSDGQISWGAADDWSRPAPNPVPVQTLIRRLNALRRIYPQFLHTGEMQKPFARIESGKYELPLRRKTEPELYDCVLNSSWSADDGSRAQFLVNYTERPQKIKITSSMDGTFHDGKLFRAGDLELELPELSAEVLLFPPACD